MFMGIVVLFDLKIGQMELGHQPGVMGGMLEGHLVKGNNLVLSSMCSVFFLILFLRSISVSRYDNQ